MNDEKKVAKKIRDRHTLMVSEQILRWRKQRLEREKSGEFLGKHCKRQREITEKDKVARHDRIAIAKGEKKFF